MTNKYTLWLLPLAAALACDEAPGLPAVTGDGAVQARKDELLISGLQAPALLRYRGGGDGGVCHQGYGRLRPEQLQLLPEAERKKAERLASAAPLRSAVYADADAEVAGVEALGVLETPLAEGGAPRRQAVVLKVPERWNGALVVAGSPDLLGELANDELLCPWLLHKGYALAVGDKGLDGGPAALLSGQHRSAATGALLLALARFAQERLTAFAAAPHHSYALGHGFAGHQVRRALELDEQQVHKGAPRLLSGGLTWNAVYWPDLKALDQDRDGAVSPQEFLRGPHLLSTVDQAAQALGYPYAQGTLTSPAAFKEQPPYKAAQGLMIAAGFPGATAPLWGYHNSAFDGDKARDPSARGVGHYGLWAMLARAELRGDGPDGAVAYSVYARAGVAPYYDWIRDHQGPGNGGIGAAAVQAALALGNSGAIGAPLLSLHGERDGFLPAAVHGAGYQAQVERAGQGARHRLYTLSHGAHNDGIADGKVDFDFDGVPGNEGLADQLAPMRAYVQRGFGYLSAWVEQGQAPPPSRAVPMDPTDAGDRKAAAAPDQLSF